MTIEDLPDKTLSGQPLVELVDHMGSDLTVVNAARVSFKKKKDKLDEKDERLIKYLARNDHWTPFSHVVVTFIFRMPICIARQWFRHTVGLTRNEMSRRYVDDPPEFMPPFGLRRRAPNAKQGSLNECLSNPPVINVSNRMEVDADDIVRISKAYYEALIDAGVAPEVARFYLPQGTLTEFWETGSLAAYARICKQRLDDHAQLEVRRYAQLVDSIMKDLFPLSWAALMESQS